jgi:hypothetical protein
MYSKGRVQLISCWVWRGAASQSVQNPQRNLHPRCQLQTGRTSRPPVVGWHMQRGASAQCKRVSVVWRAYVVQMLQPLTGAAIKAPAGLHVAGPARDWGGSSLLMPLLDSRVLLQNVLRQFTLSGQSTGRQLVVEYTALIKRTCVMAGIPHHSQSCHPREKDGGAANASVHPAMPRVVGSHKPQRLTMRSWGGDALSVMQAL